MIPVNLLPHRAERRAALQKQFFVLAFMTVCLGGAIVLLVHSYFSGQIENQKGRNQFLESEIARLDREIAEIKALREQIQAMVERKNVVESLQLNRSEAVRLLDQLVRQLPDGMYLTQVKQAGARVTVVGFSTSNARVSTFMRNLDASPFLESPTLVVVKEGAGDNQNLNEFTLTVGLTRDPASDSSQAKSQKPKS